MNETVVNGSTFIVLNGWDSLTIVIIVFFLRWVECAARAMCKYEPEELPLAVIRQVPTSPIYDDDSVSSRAQSEEQSISPISNGGGRE